MLLGWDSFRVGKCCRVGRAPARTLRLSWEGTRVECAPELGRHPCGKCVRVRKAPLWNVRPSWESTRVESSPEIATRASRGRVLAENAYELESIPTSKRARVSVSSELNTRPSWGDNRDESRPDTGTPMTLKNTLDLPFGNMQTGSKTGADHHDAVKAVYSWP